MLISFLKIKIIYTVELQAGDKRRPLFSGEWGLIRFQQRMNEMKVQFILQLIGLIDHFVIARLPEFR